MSAEYVCVHILYLFQYSVFVYTSNCKFCIPEPLESNLLVGNPINMFKLMPQVADGQV